MSITARLLALGGFTLLPLIGIEAYNEFELRAAREAEVKRQVVQRAQGVATDQQRIIDGLRDVLATLVELREIRSENAGDCVRLFSSIRPSYGGVEAIAATHADGTTFCISDNYPVPEPLPSIADRYYFKAAMETRGFVVGRFVEGRQTHQPTVHLAMPYRTPAGEVGGIIAIALNVNWLAEQLGGNGWTQDEAFSVADGGGTFLVRKPDQAKYVGMPFPPDLWATVKDATEPGTYDAESPLDGIARIIGFVPPKATRSGFYVGIGVRRSVAFAALNAATLRGAIFSALAVGLAVLLALAFGQFLIAQPIGKLSQLARQFKTGRLDAKSELGGASEFSQLGEAFEDMAGQLRIALDHKDTLLRELSHRVMNSLQTIASTIVLQGRTVTDPIAKQQLLQAVERINAVALTYRRMEVKDGATAVDLASFLRELCEHLKTSLAVDGASLVLKTEPLLLGPAQAMSLALIVNELVTNAVKHGERDAPQIRVSLERIAEHYRLGVGNRGHLPAGYDPAKTNGFGMRMVSVMVKQMGGTLTVSNSDGNVEFSVGFVPDAFDKAIAA